MNYFMKEEQKLLKKNIIKIERILKIYILIIQKILFLTIPNII